MRQLVQFLFHLFAACNFGFGIYYDVFVLKFPEDFKKNVVEYGGRWKYLTFWNLVLQFLYFSFSVLNDLLGSSSLDKKDRSFLQRVRDYVFGSLVNPLGIFVAFTFWGLFAVNRELVFPKLMDTFFPSWLNHIIHTSIVPLDFIEMILVPKTFPSKRNAIIGMATLVITYMIWVFFIAFKTNYWVYPVLAVLNWGYRLIFLSVLMACFYIFYLIGEKLHNSFWGKPSETKSVRPQNKSVNKEVKSPSKPNTSSKRKQK